MTTELGHRATWDACAAHFITFTLLICLDSLILKFLLLIKVFSTFITAFHNTFMDKLMKSGLDKQTVRQTENQLSSKACNQQHNPSWRPGRSLAVHPGANTVPNTIAHLCSRPGWWAWVPPQGVCRWYKPGRHGWRATWRDFDRREKWANRNLTKFKRKCKFLCLWSSNPVHLERSFAEEDLGVPGHKLKYSTAQKKPNNLCLTKSLQEWLNSRTGCPETLWSLSPWRFLKLKWVASQETSCSRAEGLG